VPQRDFFESFIVQNGIERTAASAARPRLPSRCGKTAQNRWKFFDEQIDSTQQNVPGGPPQLGYKSRRSEYALR
jgi:hypothetical protein